MVRLYRDPIGDKIFKGSERGTTLPEGTLPGVRPVNLVTQPSIDSGVGCADEGMNVARLQLKVRELERLLRDTQVMGEGLMILCCVRYVSSNVTRSQHMCIYSPFV